MGDFIKNGPCEFCGSSDNRSQYDDGSSYCWSCSEENAYQGSGGTEWNFGDEEEHEEVNIDMTSLQQVSTLRAANLPDRNLLEETLDAFGAKVEFDVATGEIIKHYYPYYNEQGEVIAYKVRTLPKEFSVIGQTKKLPLFGSNLIGDKGKMIIVTEGEIDAMSAHQMLREVGKNYRVVALPTGAQSFKRFLEFLNGFDTIIICLDNDDVGRKAAQNLSEMFSPGQAKIAHVLRKDIGELCENGEARHFLNAINSAKSVRPDGIVSGGSTWDIIENEVDVPSLPYPDHWEELNKMTYGIRVGELDTWTSGSGMGKSSLLKELEYHILMNTQDSLGVIALEEPLKDSVKSLMAIYLNKRIHLPDVEVSAEEKAIAWRATSGTDRIHYYDAFGSTDTSNLINKIKFLARGLGCKYIILDHLSILVSEFAAEGGERERIDTLMSQLKNLTQELDIWIGLVVHLRKTTTGGKSFEEGAVPTLDDLRGSGSIKQLSNNVYAVARNQQESSEDLRNTSSLHVLKCRFTGRTGPAGHMFFNQDTGRMLGCPDPKKVDDDIFDELDDDE